MTRTAYILIMSCIALIMAATPATAQEAPETSAALSPSELLSEIRFDQQLGEMLPLDLRFRDDAGEPVTLGDYFNRQPVLLTLVYYECPSLCTQVLSGMVDAMRRVSLDPGSDYQVVVVSISPTESHELAAATKFNHVDSFGRAHTIDGWHFLTGDEASIRQLADAVGYTYRYDPASGEYIHPGGLMIATPSGELSRYLYGVSYSARDLRLSLVEASKNRIGSPVDQFLLLCFTYDPATGTYSMTILNVIRLLGVVTLVTLVGFIGIALYREQRRRLAVLSATMKDVATMPSQPEA